MRAVIVFESMYGNTHLVAEAIAAGLVSGSGMDVEVVPVSGAGPHTTDDADLVVVGGPTHVHGMSRASTRKGAAEAAQKPDSGLALEPDALGNGLREWLATVAAAQTSGQARPKAAAFDTRFHGAAALTGRASKSIARELRHHGFGLVAPPESFLVTRENHLDQGEEDRAQAWGAALATELAGQPARG